jgi:ABC-2 type transport system ATP-binding protein
MSDVDAIVRMKGLIKYFKKKTALADVNLDIFPGHIIGLLGPDGCGKSTLLRHIIGQYVPSKGSCVTFGREATKLGPKELFRIGYVHQEGQLLNWMTVGQLIQYVSAFYPNWNKGLEQRFLNDFEINTKDRVGSLSPGQRQKVAILLAIGHEPDLLILDEPTSALDPIARAQFLELLLKIIQQEGKTILIASHILTDIEKIIDHVVIMKEGRIIEDEGMEDLRDHYLHVHLKSLSKKLPQMLTFEKALFCERDDYQAVMVLDKPYFDEIKNQAEALNCRLDVHSLPLEDLYKIIIRSGI